MGKDMTSGLYQMLVGLLGPEQAMATPVGSPQGTKTSTNVTSTNPLTIEESQGYERITLPDSIGQVPYPKVID